MNLGYDPVGNKEWTIAELTIKFLTEDCPDDELEKRTDKVGGVMDDIEEVIRVFVPLPNEVRLITER